MKMSRRRRRVPPVFFAMLILLTCTLAIGLVLLSVPQNIPSSAALSDKPIPSGGDSGSLSSQAEPLASMPEKDMGVTGSAEEPSSALGPASSREPYNPSVSSPKSSLVLGGATLDFTPEERDALDKMLDAYAPNVSVYFEDLASGTVYEYNSERHYFVASLIKAPYCLYLYTLAEQGKCDLEELLLVEEEDKQEGTGTIKDMEDLPKEFTVRELMALAIRQSDNTAMKVLLRKYPAAGYQKFAASLGFIHSDDIKYVVNGQIDAREAGRYLKEIYQYIENGRYGGELKADMMGTSYYMIQSGYPMARKYGWTAGEGKEAYHDMAVVYAPHPYLLAICSDHQDGTKADRAMFGEISQYLEKLWLTKYQQAGE